MLQKTKNTDSDNHNNKTKNKTKGVPKILWLDPFWGCYVLIKIIGTHLLDNLYNSLYKTIQIYRFRLTQNHSFGVRVCVLGGLGAQLFLYRSGGVGGA